jgi:hypothetical protein
MRFLEFSGEPLHYGVGASVKPHRRRGDSTAGSRLLGRRFAQRRLECDADMAEIVANARPPASFSESS